MVRDLGEGGRLSLEGQFQTESDVRDVRFYRIVCMCPSHIHRETIGRVPVLDTASPTYPPMYH